MPEVDLLVMGGSGFIGGRTVQAAQAAGLKVACTYLHRPPPPGATAYQLDCGDAGRLSACLEETRPRGIVYCVVTGKFGSNNEADHQYASVTVLRTLLDVLERSGSDSRLVYVSTNAVFSGKHGPYREDVEPDPHARQDIYRAYGLYRRAGEILALERRPDAIVARTANVDGRDAWGVINPRLQGLIEPLRAGQPVARFVDRGLSPTLVDNLAEALVEASQPVFAPTSGRILHLAGCETISDYEFARRIAQKVGADEKLVHEDRCLPLNSSERYSIALDVAFTQSVMNTRLLGVDALLERVFRQDQPGG